MKMAAQAKNAMAPATGDVLRRSCACGTCNSCAAKKSRNAQTAGRGLESGVAPPAVHNVLRSAGRPLDAGTRGVMEQRFGADFSSVRVHSDAQAASSAAAVQARAYTVGEHIVLGDRARGAGDEQRLYAHELAHVVQQRALGTRGIGRLATLEIGRASDPAEAEADRMAGEAMRGAVVSRPAHHPPMLRRDSAPQSTPAPAASQPAAKPAEKPAAPTKPATQLATNVDLGYAGRHVDALLHRSAAAEPGKEAAPCELELLLKLHFDFHLGSSFAPGGPWPADRAKSWKREYMNAAQSTWNTDIAFFRKTVLEPVAQCPDEPCTQAVGHLKVVDADSMTDSKGDAVKAPGLNATPHFKVDVYEFRPRTTGNKKGEKPDNNDQVVGSDRARFYTESVQSKGTMPPQGTDLSQFKGEESPYIWSPGGAPHETGHMLGLTHVNCGPGDTGDTNRDECYGVTWTQRANVMGLGSNVSEENLTPFLTGMRATTGCEWKVSSSLRKDRILGIVFGALGAALVGTAIGLGVHFGKK